MEEDTLISFKNASKKHSVYEETKRLMDFRNSDECKKLSKYAIREKLKDIRRSLNPDFDHYEKLQKRLCSGKNENITKNDIYDLTPQQKLEIIYWWSQYHEEFNPLWIYKIRDKIREEYINNYYGDGYQLDISPKVISSLDNIILKFKIDVDFWIDRYHIHYKE